MRDRSSASTEVRGKRAIVRRRRPEFETVDYLVRTPFLAIAMALRFPPKRGQPYGLKRAVLHVLFPPHRGKHGRIERSRKGCESTCEGDNRQSPSGETWQPQQH